jgi:hypothetical protein
MASVRADGLKDLLDEDLEQTLVSGDIYGVAHPYDIFVMPGIISELLGENKGGGLFWWWTETTHYLMRPSPSLRAHIAQEKAAIGWKHPIIGSA